MKTVTALRHIHFEDLGSFEAPLRAAGYTISYRSIGDADFCDFDPLAPDLLAVLGGPIGVYETDIYPFLTQEIALIRHRLEAGRPTLGVCLGAQLMAASLGARVYPAGVKEIGFAPVTLTAAGRHSPLRHLDGVPVLHWHGDTYQLPHGASLLGSTALVKQQAFSIGPNILGLQFHPEALSGAAFERWLVGHAAELAAAKIDVGQLRQDSELLGSQLAKRAEQIISEWLAGLNS